MGIPSHPAAGGDLAVVMLSCTDYEAMEVALACHMAYGDPAAPFFILQNCRGSYDAERTLGVARRYAGLYPDRIRVIDGYSPSPPYHSIARALANELSGFTLICKVDDDVFPIGPGWLPPLRRAIETGTSARVPTYVTPLINNNSAGFPHTLRAMGLMVAYAAEAAMTHFSGPPHAPRITPPTEIATGAFGSIWNMPHVARWLHERTSLDPDAFLAATRDLPSFELPPEERFSIGCILFRRELWPAMHDDTTEDDEAMLHAYCRRTGVPALCVAAVPMVHVAYFSQREELRDIVPRLRETYEARLQLRHPIALRTDRLLEIEARLRWKPAPAPPPPDLWRRIRGRLGRLLHR